MKKQSKIILITIVTLTLLGAGASGAYYYKNSQEAAAEDAQPETFAVKRQDLTVKMKSYGVVEPENRVELKPPVGGTVEQILVKEGQYVKRGSILAWMSSQERSVLLTAARAKGQEELSKWSEIYKAIPILAPIDGTIIVSKIKPGQSFSAGDAVFVMSDRLIVRAQVDEIDITKVKAGQQVELILDAFPEKALVAEVKRISFDAQRINNVSKYIVDLELKETPAYMLSGMTASLSFLLSHRPQVLVIPRRALEKVDGEWQVKLSQGNDPEAPPKMQTVKVGEHDSKFIEVTEGLQEAEVIVLPKSLAQKSQGETKL